jgi:Protein of unknown function DUF86
MRRELLLLEEMIDAAEQAHLLATRQTAHALTADRQRGTPCSGTSPFSVRPPPKLPDDLEADFPEIPWQQPSRLRNRIVHGYWSVDLDILITTAAERFAGLGCSASRGARDVGPVIGHA